MYTRDLWGLGGGGGHDEMNQMPFGYFFVCTLWISLSFPYIQYDLHTNTLYYEVPVPSATVCCDVHRKYGLHTHYIYVCRYLIICGSQILIWQIAAVLSCQDILLYCYIMYIYDLQGDTCKETEDPGCDVHALYFLQCFLVIFTSFCPPITCSYETSQFE